jgi:hypothetical protein
VEATATESASASNWSSPAAPAADTATTAEASSHSSSAAVLATSLRLPDQGRARKQRDPIEFSFHDLDFLCVLFVLLNYLVNWISEGRARPGHVPPGTATADPISRSSCSACRFWKRSTISITLRRLISLAMRATIPFDSPGTTATFSARFFGFIVIPFVVEISKRVRAPQR